MEISLLQDVGVPGVNNFFYAVLLFPGYTRMGTRYTNFSKCTDPDL